MGNGPCGRTKGLRRSTRDMFSRAFRKKGMINLGTYLQNYKIGDYVDIKVNSAVHKGMPYKFYHGKTGRVWNVTKRAVGVEINKVHRQRIIAKRIHVRVEHVEPSRCREGFLARRAENDAKLEEAKKTKSGLTTKDLRRKPVEPRGAFTLTAVEPQTITPVPYDIEKVVAKREN